MTSLHLRHRQACFKRCLTLQLPLLPDATITATNYILLQLKDCDCVTETKTETQKFVNVSPRWRHRPKSIFAAIKL